jgi:hypothetical protein
MNRNEPLSPSLQQRSLEPRCLEPRSLEERLRVVRERCRLLADMFSIQAEAAWLALHVSLSVDTYNALTDLCRSSAEDLERLSQEIPGAIANWHAEDGRDAEPNYASIADVQAP